MTKKQKHFLTLGETQQNLFPVNPEKRNHNQINKMSKSTKVGVTSTVVELWWKKRFGRFPDSAEVNEMIVPWTKEKGSTYCVLVKDLGSFKQVIVHQPTGRTRRMFLEQ